MGNFATLRSQVGIAKEATKMTAVPPTAFIPVKKFDADPKVAKLQDTGWRGSMGDNYGLQNGVQYAELSLSGDCFADTIGYLINGVLGDLVTTGAASPYTHKIALKNNGDGQPISYTLTDTQGGLQPRAYAGAQFSEVNFKWDPAGLLTYDAKAVSKLGATAAAPTASYGTLTPIASWLGALKFGATTVANIEQAEVNIKRASAEPIWAVSGAADPYALWVGGASIDGKFVFVATDESPYTQMAANTSPGIVTAGFSQSASSQLNFTFSQPLYDTAKITRGKSYVEIEATWKAVFNSTDVGASGGFGPGTISVVNSLASGTFG